MDSKIVTGAGGTAFAGPDAVRLFQAATVASALGLMAKGIRPNRAWTNARALATATGFTGKKYGRGKSELLRAQADLTAWANAMRAALPVEAR